MTEFGGSLPNEYWAVLKTELDVRAEQFLVAARKSGKHDLRSAYLADALVDLVHGDAAAKRVNINVVVDHAVLVGGEGVCEIPGFGPIAPETVEAWSRDCWLNVLLRRGRDITTIASEKRHVPADVRKVLDLRAPICSVRGCETTVGLERDHRHELQHGGLTEVDNLALLCRHHHKLKTHDGFTLEGESGEYTLVPPDKSSAAEQAKLFPPGT